MAVSAHAQDTTTSRLIVSGTYPANIYFTSDTGMAEFARVLPDGMSPFNSTTQGVFMHPEDYRLYALMDTGGFAERSLYEVNPLTGENTMVYNLGDLFASVEITDSGRIFGIHGNGGNTPGAVYEIDMFNQSMSMAFQSSVPQGQPRALGFNPNSQELYVLCGFIDTIYRYDMNTWNETAVSALLTEEVHGAAYRDDTLGIVSYSGDVGFIDLASSYDATWQYGVFDNAMDLCDIKLVDAPATYSACQGTYLSALYESNSYAWYVDGVMVPNSDTIAIEITSSGTYQVVQQISDTTQYIMSEAIDVTMFNLPMVQITPQDTLICEGDTIALMGSFGGTSQWYRNGSPIAGADSDVYMASMTGSYNMVKTNMNGCSDSAAVPATIGFLPSDSCMAIGTGEEPEPHSFVMYPNPTSGILDIQSGSEISVITVRDISGKVVLRQYENNTTRTSLDLLGLRSGIYMIEVAHAAGTNHERVLKL